jgi:CRP/FNR family transcriptional regulator, cyclic AMP receptor protein
MNINESQNHSDRLIDIIMDIPFFEKLNNRELATVAKYVNYFEISKGEILFKEGDPGDSVCFVVKGRLDVYKKASTPGKQVKIASVTKKRSIGEMAVIDEYTRSATVRACSDACIVSLTKSGFDALLQENPKIGAAILKKIATLVSMNLRSTSSRLADYINILPIA